MSKKRNLINQKFNRLLVIKEANRNSRNKIMWLCLCDCGNYVEILGDYLVYNRTKSCGCLHKELAIQKGKNSGPGLRKEDTGLRTLYNQYRTAAKRQKREFNISLEEFKVLTSNNCFYSGHPPSYIKTSTSKNKDTKEYSKYIYNGIDRINNDKGYVLDNCVTCCKLCNRAKNNLSFDEFIDWASTFKPYES